MQTNFRIFKYLKIIKLLTILKVLVIVTAVTFSVISIGCKSSTIANSQIPASSTNSQLSSTLQVHTCRTQIGIYSEKPVFDVEFDFEDKQFKHLPIAIKRHGESQEREELKVWDALYGTDGDYNYWTTPILRDYSLEKTNPLVISRASSRKQFSSTAEKLKTTLVANYRNRDFPINCALKTVFNQKDSSTNNAVSYQARILMNFILVVQKSHQAPNLCFDVEFDYLTNAYIQNIYVQVKLLFGKNADNVRYLEAFFGSDGDYSFWTTPVLRDISGGTFPLVIDMEPGIIGVPDNRSRLHNS